MGILRRTIFSTSAAVACASLLQFVRCAPGENGARRAGPAAEAPIEMMVANDPETLDPRYATDAVGLRTTRLVHAGLVRLDPDTLEPKPYAASGWRWIDPLTLRVELREDVRFHSGAPLTADDVVATLRAIRSPKVGSRQAGIFEALADAQADGPHTVIFRLARAHATLLTDLEVPILRADQAASPPAPDGSLDGLGPYAVARSARGEVQLEPAADGVLPKPARGVVLRTVHDENTRALRLESARADVALNLVSPMLLPALDGVHGLSVRSRPGANLTYMVIDEARAALGDAAVRRAISLSIDRAMLCSTLFDGHAHPATGLIAPSLWLHGARAADAADAADPADAADLNTAPFSFDPAAARALWAGAETDAANTANVTHALGVNKIAGAHLTLLTSTERLRGDVARTIAQELGETGLDVTVVPLELGTLLARLTAGNFDLAILQLPEMTEPNVLRHFLHSAFVPPAGANRGRVHDAVLDEALDEGDRVSDPAARRAIYARVEARERQELHLVPLWYEDQVAVVSERARAFVPSAEGRWLGLASIP
ncbi:MAG TPA: ABC transporter substrate-binding protein [Polyangiaceae bacterium]|nr:ABC transporter substrate-binding protein [Polyangiaceae bacterium]